MHPDLKKEADLWRSVCAQLKALGAVTEDDLSKPRVTLEPSTPGEQLIRTIRKWGRAYENICRE